MKPTLTAKLLLQEAKDFAQSESGHRERSLFGVTDGKAVGTYLEHKFQDCLQQKYSYVKGSSAKGVDFPKLGVDIKVTSITQPQSSCPFKSARQKVYGLGYSLLVFVAFMSERFLPLDDIQARQLAEEILKKRPEVGYLTISNALQWRLQYSRVIEQAGKVAGVNKVV
jgi:hypothetical protein